jgi:hypothetical protein
MAHFAKLENNKVVDVIVVNNEDILDENGNESEAVGIAFLQSIFGDRDTWVQTSYNGTFRKNFAMIGGVYDEIRDAFIAAKEYDKWILNEETCCWEPPTPMPNSNYQWDDYTGTWVLGKYILDENAVE